MSAKGDCPGEVTAPRSEGASDGEIPATRSQWGCPGVGLCVTCAWCSELPTQGAAGCRAHTLRARGEHGLSRLPQKEWS